MLTNTLSLIQKDEFTDIELSEYSKFKHGSKTIARSFGKALSKVVGQSILPEQDIIIYPPPFNHVPTAGSALKDYLLSSLAPTILEKDVKVTQGKITRLYSYDEDYGKMSKERVKIRELLDRKKVLNDCIFVYLYEYTGDRPSIEHDLNHFSVNNLKDVNRIIVNDEFIFNTRVIKYILRADIEEFVSFITYQSDTFLETLYTFSVLNEHHKNPKYTVNFGILHNLLKLKN